jgi:uncharacterized protein
MKAFALSALTLVAVLALAPAHADRAAGAAAYARGDYEAAYRLWAPLAERGDTDLQYRLGTMHEWGMGVAMDYREAVKWYRLAAAQGHVEAQFTLGFMYGSGTGVRQDDVLAYAWYELAALQGDGTAREFRDVTGQKLGREQIATARRIARRLGGGH